MWCNAVWDLAVRRVEENREQADQNEGEKSWNGRNLVFRTRLMPWSWGGGTASWIVTSAVQHGAMTTVVSWWARELLTG